MSSDTTVFMEIQIGEYNPVTMNLVFASKEAALAQLAILEPLLGQGKFRNDPSTNRHRIVSDDGETVVVLEHVRCARVVDMKLFREGATWEDERLQEHSARLAQSIAQAVVIAQKTMAGAPPEIIKNGTPDHVDHNPL